MNSATSREPFTSPLTPWERSFLGDKVARAQGVHIKNGMKYRLDYEKEVEEAMEAFRNADRRRAHKVRLELARRAKKRKEVTA